MITAKFIAAVSVRVLSCECCGSDASNDVAAFAGTIVNSCCWESCGCCCSYSKDNCDICCIDNSKIHSCCWSECRVVNVVAVIRAMMWLLLQGLL